MSPSQNPIIIVTGANSGVGFGICQRFLFQLCQATPADSKPQYFAPTGVDSDCEPFPACDGVTLIMACRSTKRAEAARTNLVELLDAHVERVGGRAREFRKNVRIVVHELDLAVVSSVFRFANEISQKYPYISHLICNAGVASFSGIAWIPCFKQLIFDPMGSITRPAFYMQHEGEVSVDGFGWVWQSNVFGHYILFRSIQHLMHASTFPLGPRVVWMSSLEASPKLYESDDWQLKNTNHSYESSKYQIDLVAMHLDRRALQETGPNRIRHFVTEPGMCSTNVSAALAGPFLDVVKIILFYIGRFFGSPHHTIQPYKAAIGAVHLSLASFAFLTLAVVQPTKFSSATDRWGEGFVLPSRIVEWEAQTEAGAGEVLLSRCEALYQSMKIAEKATVDSETA